ncbi:hypothetical protein N7526_003438 [Penicillium atrosanguineum]|nr:hypothetical protein N7526_003438 [Penicillium atrosanguineum]
MSDRSPGPFLTVPNKRSCKRCNERKVRCDRNTPCGACIKTGDQCIFPGPKRAPRILNRPPISELLTRLTELETEVQRLRSSKNLELDADEQQSSELPDLIQSPGSYADLFGLPRGKWLDKNNQTWSQDSFRQHYLGQVQIQTLWCIYQKNVVPLIAVLHLPTAARIFEDASKGFSIDSAREGLLLSICFAAVVSVDPEQLRSELGLEYQAALRDYEMAVHQALSRAEFIKSPEIFTLQAAVPYLLCARVDGDTRLVWVQSAVIIRLAQSQCIHRDGKKIGLAPFETEIRRRLWWHICILDMLCSEDQGVDMQIRPGTFDTRFPSNVDGADLKPHMLELPPERKGFADITLCIMNSFMINEVHLSTQPLNSVASLQDRRDLIKSVGATLHERYLDHFNLGIPIHWVFATIVRLYLSKAWVSEHKQLPSSGLHGPRSEYQSSVFRTAVELVEFAYFLQTNDVTTQWGWLCRSYKQKEVIAYILDEISTRPNDPETNRAWEVVTKTTSLWMQCSSGAGRVPEEPLLELIQRADMLRETKMKIQTTIQMDGLVGEPPVGENVDPESWNQFAIQRLLFSRVNMSGSYSNSSALAWLQGIWPYQSINDLSFT